LRVRGSKAAVIDVPVTRVPCILKTDLLSIFLTASQQGPRFDAPAKTVGSFQKENAPDIERAAPDFLDKLVAAIESGNTAADNYQIMYFRFLPMMRMLRMRCAARHFFLPLPR
jgi:hypothetical protein